MVAPLIKNLYLPIEIPCSRAAPIWGQPFRLPTNRLALATNSRFKKAKETRMQTSSNTKTLLLSLLLLATGSAWAGWEGVSTSASSHLYIDRATLRKDGNLRRMWSLQDLKQRDEGGVMSFRARYEYDCKNERNRILSMSTHSEPMAGGKTLFIGGEHVKWSEIPPGSAIGIALEIACAQ